ncbi:LRR-containing protein [Plasmopara halstedii]|uniref:LRR-containing protein n=1 Tax=Plasmopara halstedii TaxID=4781 RepID=A0A0P1AFP6_PLAHL|nr:LRR-containing protein [Plasmopara halstedii]CEG39572.1 LRR-containing protein [Plasmopara halstedii]|eukprot:XP_024575941.1 LRR-containing protein [Plasmopara halstedii]
MDTLSSPDDDYNDRDLSQSGLKTSIPDHTNDIQYSGAQEADTFKIQDEHKSEDCLVVSRRMAWTQVIESFSILQASIFNFIVPFASPTSSKAIVKSSVQSTADSAALPENNEKKQVRFSPDLEQDQSSLVDNHVLLNDSSNRRLKLLSRMEESRQIERSYVVPKDLPPFKLWDRFQLGLSLTYTTLRLRRNISAPCLVFEEQRKQTNKQNVSSITATQLVNLAHAGLAFNTSTRSFVIQGQPSLPVKSLEKPRQRKSRKLARLRHNRIAIRLGNRKKERFSKLLKCKMTKSKTAIHTARHHIKLKAKGGAESQGTAHDRDRTKIGSFGAIAVFRALRVNRTLLSLKLEYLAIDDTALSALAAALRVNCSLTHLSLAGNRIGPIGARDLADALEDSPDSMLLDLDLRDNHLGTRGAEELGRALRENETLTRCDLSWNQMGPHAVLGLLSALRDNFVFRELCVYGNDRVENNNVHLWNLDYSSAKDIIVGLRHLNASFAVIRLSSVRALIPIDKIKTSRWLDVADRGYVELDGLVVAGLLSHNSMLLSLDMHDNPNLGGPAVIKILTAIRNCSTLRDVDLSNTGLYPSDGEVVGELVSANCTLLTIKMHVTVIFVQQARGNQNATEVPDAIECFVDPTHFLDRWIYSKCFAVNRLTQELNNLRLSDVPHLMTLNTSTNYRLNLVSVNICGRLLELYEVAFLGSKILNHRHLGRVVLNSCMLDSAAACALANGVRDHPTLHTVELENNPFGPVGGHALAECLASSNALTYLNLSWTQLGDGGVLYFREALKQNQSIERLDLRGNDLRVQGIIAIADGVRHSATLRELHLRWNTVSPVGAEALAKALEVNQSLRLLDVEHHTMGSRGAAAFASMLAKNKHLEHLNIGGIDSNDTLDVGSGIGSQQAKRIAEILQNSNKSLRILHIGSNCIDPEATAQFGELLATNKTLVTLDLSHSDLTAAKASRFFACLSVNNTLEQLDLAHNHIGNEGMMACTRALETNRTLRELNLAYNGITEEPLAVLVAKLHAIPPKIAPSLEWLCLIGNVMTERTHQQYTLLPQHVITIELHDEERR